MLSFDFHSPTERLDLQLFQDKGIQVDIKRDDMIHPFISGNKWRKLKYVLHSAVTKGKTHLVTFGGAWSNHLLATACAGARFGFKTTGIVRGEEVSNPVLSLCKVFGMHLIFVARSAYRDKYALFNAYFGGDKQAYFIDEGGYSALGAEGCREIIGELAEAYDHIFCACGTGTTLAGLVMEKRNKHLATTLHGISVLAGGNFLREAILKLYPSETDDFYLHTDYHFGGYAKSNEILTTFIRWFCSNTGILIEPIYTGKLFYAVFDLVTNDYFKPGDKILAIHTGGVTGLLGMHERIT